MAESLESFTTRIDEWIGQVRADLSKSWWGFVLVLVATFAFDLMYHRILEGTNHFIDDHIRVEFRPTALAFVNSQWLRPVNLTLVVFVGVILAMLLHAYWETRTSRSGSGSLVKRTRRLARNLAAFVEKNEGNVTAIHFLYEANFRARVDRTLSELAAEEVCDILEGDWVINPQIQTVKNIRENVIVQLTKSADRLEVKQSAPRSKLIGEIQAGKFTVFGESVDNGQRTYTTNVCVQLRVTNKERIATTLKRAIFEIRVGGDTYRGVKTSLWNPRDGKDLLQYITNKTPIQFAIATTGLLEFTVPGFKHPDRSINADATVVLIDEFDVQHRIRNKNLWVTV